MRRVELGLLLFDLAFGLGRRDHVIAGPALHEMLHPVEAVTTVLVHVWFRLLRDGSQRPIRLVMAFDLSLAEERVFCLKSLALVMWPIVECIKSWPPRRSASQSWRKVNGSFGKFGLPSGLLLAVASVCIGRRGSHRSVQSIPWIILFDFFQLIRVVQGS